LQNTGAVPHHEGGDEEELILVLRRMSKALGGGSKLAHEAELNVNAFYRTLSAQGNPQLKSPRGVSTGMQVTIRPLRKRVT
jgi:DNA-binding phage protein